MVETGGVQTLYIDGEVSQTLDVSAKRKIDLGWMYEEPFMIGRSAKGRHLSGYVTEARLWNKALTGIELKNNQCKVNPNADGLLGYWRLDEVQSDGLTVKDLTGNGFDAVANSNSITWVDFECPVRN